MKYEKIDLRSICKGPIMIEQINDNIKAMKSNAFASFGLEKLNFSTNLYKSLIKAH